MNTYCENCDVPNEDDTTYTFQTSDGLVTYKLHPSHFGFLQNYDNDGNPIELFDITQKEADEGIKLYQQYLELMQYLTEFKNGVIPPFEKVDQLCIAIKDIQMNPLMRWLDLHITDEEKSFMMTYNKMHQPTYDSILDYYYFLHNKSLKFMLYHSASFKGHLNVIKYAYTHLKVNRFYDGIMTDGLIEQNHVNCIKWMQENNYFTVVNPYKSFIDAITNVNMELMVEIVRQEPQIHHANDKQRLEIAVAAIKSGKVDIIKYIEQTYNMQFTCEQRNNQRGVINLGVYLNLDKTSKECIEYLLEKSNATQTNIIDLLRKVHSIDTIKWIYSKYFTDCSLDILKAFANQATSPYCFNQNKGFRVNPHTQAIETRKEMIDWVRSLHPELYTEEQYMHLISSPTATLP
jgi:hypothetical protein